MRHFIVLLSSLILFTACDKARFDSGGSNEKSANGFEVVTEDEENSILGEGDTTDEGLPSDTCVGEDCTDDDGGDNPENPTCKGKDCDHEDDTEHSCRNPHHHHNDGDKKDKHPNKECKDCVVSPDTIYKDEHICRDHACGEGNQDHKIHICKWPNGDESKEMTLCVAKASLQGMVKTRRQDIYYVGACPDLDHKAKELVEEENKEDH